MLQLRDCLFASALVFCVSDAALGAPPVDVQVRVNAPGHAISPRLVGVFFEDINFGADGGLSAELIKNASFEFPRPLTGWRELRPSGAQGGVSVLRDAPRAAANPNYLRLAAHGRAGGYGVANDGFRGMGVRRGQSYEFSAWARSADGAPAALRLQLTTPDGMELAMGRVDIAGTDWREVKAILRSSETEAKASLEIMLTSPGSVDLDAVSLCPADTWKGRPHGLRSDLVQLLSELQPAFLRFPGGCIVEGSQLKYRYQWKTTIGDPTERKLLVNRWSSEFAHRPAPDYYQSFAVGFFEYFQLAEDLGAEPLPILNCGMACQFNSAELASLADLDPYIQDALDLIEFANGPATSPWGARRAAMGHPEPFGLKMLGVGNEQWDAPYFERYEAFAKALKDKHPEIELVSGAGPFPSDERFRRAWSHLRELDADIIDEHSYAMPDWFLRSATRYDGYDRRGPRVFMGEYAAQSIDITSPNNRNNLRCALAEAAFLTGIERNSDVVVMSSYAPLFGHEEAWQWRPNLIWVDNLSAYATPNYYVQQLFSRHRGDVVLPVALEERRPPRPAQGRIGVGARQASASFKDIRVTRGDELLYSGMKSSDLNAATAFRGRWVVEDGELKQLDPRTAARLTFGDYSWSDCVIALKAQKTAGRGGLYVVFRNSDGGSFIEWNLGGWENKQHGLVAYQAEHSESGQLVDRREGTIEDDRWYDVRIELEGDRVRCFLDGRLIHDVAIPALQLPGLFVAASRDRNAGELILKFVNPTSEETPVNVALQDATRLASHADVWTLAGAPEDENSIAEPGKITPRPSRLAVAGPELTHALPPYSFTVLRLREGARADEGKE